MTHPGPADPGDWDVGVVWLTRSLRRPDRMLRDRAAATRNLPAERASTESRSVGSDLAEGCFSAVDLPAVLVAVVVIVVLVAAGPALFALTVGVIEIAVLILATIGGLAARVLFGQPWQVVARRGGERHEWRITGHRRARALVDEIETGLRLGLDPAGIAPGHGGGTPAAGPVNVPALYRSAEFRVVGRVFGLVLGLAATAGLALLAVRFS